MTTGTLIFSIMMAPSAQGLFVGAVSLSGSPNITMNAEAKWSQDAPIVVALGCANYTTAAQRLACLRALPAPAVTKVQPPSWGTPGIFGWDILLPPPSAGGQNYAGIVHVDGVLLPMEFEAAMHAGINGEAGIIISNMAAEPDGSYGPVRGFTPAQVRTPRRTSARVTIFVLLF